MARWPSIPHPVRATVLALVLVVFLTTPGRSTMWQDPSWSAMLTESAVIVRVEVVRGGREEALVRAVEVVKGDVPDMFLVGGFNDLQRPSAAIRKDRMQAGERYYLFLANSSDMGGACSTRQVYRTWSPAAGVLPIDDDGVHYHLQTTTHVRHAPAQPLAPFRRFLAATLANQSSGADEGYLADLASDVCTPTMLTSEPKTSLAIRLAMLPLAGFTGTPTCTDDLLARPEPHVRLAVVGLLASTPTSHTVERLGKLLSDAHPVVRAAAVAALVNDNDEDRVSQLLIAHLAEFELAGASNVMEPNRRMLPASLATALRFLVENDRQDAIPAIRELLRDADRGVRSSAFDALRHLADPTLVDLARRQLEEQLVPSKGDGDHAQYVTELLKFAAAQNDPALSRSIRRGLDLDLIPHYEAEAIGLSNADHLDDASLDDVRAFLDDQLPRDGEWSWATDSYLSGLLTGLSAHPDLRAIRNEMLRIRLGYDADLAADTAGIAAHATRASSTRQRAADALQDVRGARVVVLQWQPPQPSERVRVARPFRAYVEAPEAGNDPEKLRQRLAEALDLPRDRTSACTVDTTGSSFRCHGHRLDKPPLSDVFESVIASMAAHPDHRDLPWLERWDEEGWTEEASWKSRIERVELLELLHARRAR